MAYGNWGAFVYRNGERMPDRENVGVFDTEEAEFESGFRIYANIIKHSKKWGSDEEDYPWYEHSHHAVLGDGPVRLCGYKDKFELWVMRDDGPAEEEVPDFARNADHERIGAVGSVFEMDGKEWEWEVAVHSFFNVINLRLIEPDGVVWTATCGYEYGVGHMEED